MKSQTCQSGQESACSKWAAAAGIAGVVVFDTILACAVFTTMAVILFYFAIAVSVGALESELVAMMNSDFLPRSVGQMSVEITEWLGKENPD